jgi:hypothetical protein
MCGYRLDAPDASCPTSSHSDFDLCEGCRSELEDFLKIKRGEKVSDVLWHNEKWMTLWSAWLDYTQAIKELKDSREFKQSTQLLTADD